MRARGGRRDRVRCAVRLNKVDAGDVLETLAAERGLRGPLEDSADKGRRQMRGRDGVRREEPKGVRRTGLPRTNITASGTTPTKP